MEATEAKVTGEPGVAASTRWRQAGQPRPPSMIWLPAVMVGLAMLLPLAYLVLRGATASEEAWDLLFRPRTAAILGRSLLLMATVTATSVLLAVPLAWLTVRTDLPFRRLWALLTTLPLVIPSYIGAFLVVSALGPKGLLLQLVDGPFGVDRLPDIHGLAGATVTLSLLSYPYILLTVRGAMRSLSPALEESAQGLGHGMGSTLLRVVLPQLRPAIVAGSLLVALYTLSDFGAVSLMRFETFTWAIYQQYQSALDRSIAAVLSLALVALALGILILEGFSRGRLRYYTRGGAARMPHPVRLGRWKWPAVAFCASVVSLALALPLGILGYWLVRGLSSGEALPNVWNAAWNSLYVSGMAAVAAAACAIPVAMLTVRYPSALSRGLERVGFVGYALPGITVALALVYFGANYASPVYLTVWLLAFAYVVLFFPAALGAIRSSLLQIDPRLEEAARGLGKNALQTAAYVTIPLIRPGMLMGVALVFLVAMKELPATLILGPLDFKTLATSVWSESTEAFFARAAAPAIVLILLSSLPIALLLSNDRRLRW